MVDTRAIVPGMSFQLMQTRSTQTKGTNKSDSPQILRPAAYKLSLFNRILLMHKPKHSLDTKYCPWALGIFIYPQWGKDPDQVSINASGGRKKRLLKISIIRKSRARKYGTINTITRTKPRMILVVGDTFRSLSTYHGLLLIQKLTGTIDRGGKTEIIIEEILQVSAS